MSTCQEFFSYYVKPYATIDQASDSVFSQPNVTTVSLNRYNITNATQGNAGNTQRQQTNKQFKKFLHLYNGNIIFGCLIYEGSMPFILQCMNVAILQEQKNAKTI